MTIRILHVVSSLGSGGVERMLLNYRLAIGIPDEVQFDFAVHGGAVGELEYEFGLFGSEIHHLTPKRVSILRNIGQLYRVIRDGGYDVVHAHQNLSNAIPLSIAKFLKVPVRISHGHGFTGALGPYLLTMRLITQSCSNYSYACTNEVGRWLHGKRWDSQPNQTFVMKNAINIGDFSFDQAARYELRAKFHASDKPLFLQVGRLSSEKNHLFTLDILEMLARDGVNGIFVIAGSGPMEAEIRQRASDLGLHDRTYFVGFTKDVSKLMSAADVLLMPSLSEGLGLVAIEAQVMGLPVVASMGVPEAVCITDLVQRVSLKEPQAWIDAIQRAPMAKGTSHAAELIEHGYEVEGAATNYLTAIRGALRYHGGTRS